MSISAHGRSRLNCVCRWSSGFCRARQAGDPHLGRREGVHPGDDADAVSARVGFAQHRLMPSGVVTTGLTTMRTGIAADVVEARGDRRGVLRDLRERSSPYRCWLPVTNRRS